MVVHVNSGYTPPEDRGHENCPVCEEAREGERRYVTPEDSLIDDLKARLKRAHTELARIDELEKKHERLRGMVRNAEETNATWMERTRVAEEEMRMLRESLKPFVALGPAWHKNPETGTIDVVDPLAINEAKRMLGR
jgi:DNA repair exonuclease SbcCD ATPase subunit